MFKIGQIVLCIASGASATKGGTLGPSVTKGSKYTIASLQKIYGVPTCTLEETGLVFWMQDRFVPLEDNFADEVLENIKKQIEQEELVLV